MSKYAAIDDCAHVLHDVRGGCSGCNYDIESIVVHVEDQRDEARADVRLLLAAVRSLDTFLEFENLWDDRGGIEEATAINAASTAVHALLAELTSKYEGEG